MTSNKNFQKSKATICIVNYKTELLTKLCLRSIRKFVKYPVEVIVVDNDSADSSLEYLRSLSWIRLIERSGEVNKSGSWAHGTALDIGLEATESEYFIAMHSDTFIHRPGLIEYLINLLGDDEKIACAGGGKLELKPKWKMLLKKYTDIKKWMKQLSPLTKRDDFYIRTICALYRTEILMKEKLRFAMNVDDGVTCGKQLYYELIDRGYRTKPVPPLNMSDYIFHLAHATMVLNPEFTVRKNTEKKCRRSLENLLNSTLVNEILNDSFLDK